MKDFKKGAMKKTVKKRLDFTLSCWKLLKSKMLQIRVFPVKLLIKFIWKLESYKKKLALKMMKNQVMPELMLVTCFLMKENESLIGVF